MKMKTTRKKSLNKNVAPIINRRAKFDYDLKEDLIVGLELTGAETKSARMGHVSLRGSYVVPRRGAKNRDELFLINAGFTLPNFSRKPGEQQTTVDSRQRKVLAKRKEIDALIDAKQNGMSIIPTKLLTNGRYVKLVIALGKGKKNYDKRATIREKDLKLENARLRKYNS